MELRQLTAFVTVADVGSVTKAAKLLHLVQPAVTRQIQLVEEELGVELFERTGHGMVLTPAGEKLIVRARRALHEIERARAEVRPISGPIQGLVTVGLVESVIDVVVEPIVARVAAKYPGVQLRLLMAYSGTLREWLDSSEVDVALLNSVGGNHSLAVFPLLTEPLWIVGPPEAGLREDSPVTWSTALEQPLVLPVGGLGMRPLIDKAHAVTGHPPRVVAEANTRFLLKELVLRGHGWTVLPAVSIARDVAAGVLSGAPLVDPDITRGIVLAFQRARRIPTTVEAVASEIRSLVRETVQMGRWAGARLHEEGTGGVNPGPHRPQRGDTSGSVDTTPDGL